MRISLCNEVIATLPFERQCAFARQVGYDGLEIAPFTIADEAYLLPQSRRAGIRRTASDEGIAITSLHWLLAAPKGLSITAADAPLRARTIDAMRRLIALAADLGARVLVHGSPAARQLDRGDEASGRKRGVDAFATVAGEAEMAGVLYCIEPLASNETAFINTMAEAAAIVDEIGSPALRSMIDCSAAARTETDPIAEIVRRWVPSGHIAHVHFNDPNRRGPGEGKLAFAPIVEALAAAGYSGDAAVEPFVYEPDGPTCAARGIGYLRGILEGQSAVPRAEEQG
jgi:D-psicose/D-tagatose/L-ribulose 3-epimerase